MTEHGTAPGVSGVPDLHEEQGVELLLALSEETRGGVDETLRRALGLAAEFFGTEFGIVSHVVQDSYVVDHVHQPAGAGIEREQEFDLGSTYCCITLGADDVVSIEQFETSEHAGHPCYEAFGLSTYLGVPLRVGGEVYGTLNFSSPEPREQPWTETDRQLVRLMARWIEGTIEQDRMQRRLSGALDERDRVNRELEQRNRDLDHFTRLASHDLQAPIRNLISLSELLTMELGEDLSDCADQALGYLQKASWRMQTLVQDLLEFCRSGDVAIDDVSVDLDECLDEALAVLAEDLRDTDLVRSPLPEVRGQASLLTQVFQNLVGNAVKYQEPENRPRVTVSGREVGGTVEVTVEDNGIGIDPRYVDNVFAPFQRLHGSGTYEGTGLGLPICRKILQRHGGTIRVESTPGEGSRFVFSLPRRAERAA